MGTQRSVTVRSIEGDTIVLSTDDGQTLYWPLKELSGSDLPVKEGDVLILTLTASYDLINDLLADHGTHA